MASKGNRQSLYHDEYLLTGHQVGARWPTAADIRVKTFIHDHNLYNSEDPDFKVLPLVKSISKGTELEKFDVNHFSMLKERLCERIQVLSRDLEKKGLIEKDIHNSLQKALTFQNMWRNRHSHYRPPKTVTKSPPSPADVDIYEMDSTPPAKSTGYKPPTARMVSTPESPTQPSKVRSHSPGPIDTLF